MRGCIREPMKFPIMLPPVPASSVVHHSIADLQLRSNRRLTMIGLALIAVPAIWFVRTDLALFAGDWTALSARFAVRFAMVGLPVLGVVLVRSAELRVAYARRLFAIALGVAVAFVAICALRPSLSGLPMRSPLFTIAMMYAALPNARWRQVLPPLLMTVGLVGLELAWLGSAGPDIAGDIVIFGALNVAGWLIVDRRLKLESELEQVWQREQRAQAELRTLRGIIPICAHCKSVRSELGDWQQIEQYVRQHSAAEFSHGICPDCLQKHYPETADCRSR